MVRNCNTEPAERYDDLLETEEEAERIWNVGFVSWRKLSVGESNHLAQHNRSRAVFRQLRLREGQSTAVTPVVGITSRASRGGNKNRFGEDTGYRREAEEAEAATSLLGIRSAPRFDPEATGESSGGMDPDRDQASRVDRGNTGRGTEGAL